MLNDPITQELIAGAVERLRQVGRPVCVCIFCGRVGGQYHQGGVPSAPPNRIPDGWSMVVGPIGACQECFGTLDRLAAI